MAQPPKVGGRVIAMPAKARAPKPARAPSDPHRLAVACLNRHYKHHDGRPLLKFWDSRWWVWEAGRWVSQEPDVFQLWLNRAVRAELDAVQANTQVSRSLVTNVAQALGGTVLSPAKVTRMPSWLGAGTRYYIALKNGLLDLEGRLVPHDPAWFSQVCLPYSYDAEALCPTFLRFIQAMFQGDQAVIATIQEWFGYCLTAPYYASETIAKDATLRLQRFLLLLGRERAGKSVLGGVLTSMLGRENVSNVPLSQFSSPFRLHATLGKLLNLCSEATQCSKADETTFKEFTGNDRMFFDRKFLAPINTYPTARVMMTANETPKFSDPTGALWRRMVVIHCEYSVPIEQDDKHLAQKLEAELPGILNWALEGWHRLREQGDFIEPAISVETKETLRSSLNQARRFFLDWLESDPAGEVDPEYFDKLYTEWCAENREKPLSSSELGKELKFVFPHLSRPQRRVGAERLRVYKGIKIRE